MSVDRRQKDFTPRRRVEGATHASFFLVLVQTIFNCVKALYDYQFSNDLGCYSEDLIYKNFLRNNVIPSDIFNLTLLENMHRFVP